MKTKKPSRRETQIKKAFKEISGARKVMKIKVLCPYRDCPKRMTLKGMKRHLKTKHGITVSY